MTGTRFARARARKLQRQEAQVVHPWTMRHALRMLRQAGAIPMAERSSSSGDSSAPSREPLPSVRRSLERYKLVRWQRLPTKTVVRILQKDRSKLSSREEAALLVQEAHDLASAGAFEQAIGRVERSLQRRRVLVVEKLLADLRDAQQEALRGTDEAEGLEVDVRRLDDVFTTLVPSATVAAHDWSLEKKVRLCIWSGVPVERWTRPVTSAPA